MRPAWRSASITPRALTRPPTARADSALLLRAQRQQVVAQSDRSRHRIGERVADDAAEACPRSIRAANSTATTMSVQ